MLRAAGVQLVHNLAQGSAPGVRRVVRHNLGRVGQMECARLGVRLLRRVVQDSLSKFRHAGVGLARFLKSTPGLAEPPEGGASAVTPRVGVPGRQGAALDGAPYRHQGAAYPYHVMHGSGPQ